MKSIEIIEKEGWYAAMDDNVTIFVDSYFVVSGRFTVLHYTKESYKGEETEKDDYYTDYNNKKGKVDVYPTAEQCTRADNAKLSFVKKKKELELLETKRKAIELLKGMKENDILEVVKESTGYDRHLVGDYEYKILKQRSKAFSILTNRQISADFESHGATCIPLDSIARVSSKDGKITIALNNNQLYSIGKNDDDVLFGALTLIYHL